MSSLSWDVAIALVFVVGLLLFGIGSAMLRSVPRASRKAGPLWPQLIDESLESADKRLRLDMIERLSIVRTSWSRDVLQRARSEEVDPEVLSAIEGALRA